MEAFPYRARRSLSIYAIHKKWGAPGEKRPCAKYGQFERNPTRTIIYDSLPFPHRFSDIRDRTSGYLYRCR